MFVALSVFAFGFNVNAVENDIGSSNTPAGAKSPCATIEVSESESDYLIYNIETGTTSYYSFANLFGAEANTITNVDGESTPSKVVGEEIPPSEPVSPSAIVGTDNRTKVNSTTVGPYSSTVYIVATFKDGSNNVTKKDPVL